jgi:acyl-CoA reductase-like NAD-dependent aldehyde dehydrogenase
VSKHEDVRLSVRKMYKLYIGGAFVRSESGRSDPTWDGKEFGANIARASRKDARDAVVAARAAAAKWWNTAPATRGLVLYRLAEMLEGRRGDFPQDEIGATIDRIIWYAGWCDKYSALLSTRNPVSGPHFNFSTVEPTGVVALLCPDRPALLGLVTMLMPALVAGNAVVLVASQTDPRVAIEFAEALATSDLPAGVVNILTGFRSEIAPVLAKHMDVNALGFEDSDRALTTALQTDAADNVKRSHVLPERDRQAWFAAQAQSLDEIAAYCEIKTIWHPAGV